MVINKQKKIIIALLCFLVGGIGLIWFILGKIRQATEDKALIPSSPPNLTIDRMLGESGWDETKTYSNATYGYSIQYPGRYLNPMEVESSSSVSIGWNNVARRMDKLVSYLSFGWIQVNVIINPPNTSFENLKRLYESDTITIGMTKIAGYDAIILTTKFPLDPVLNCKDYRRVLFTKENLFFMIDTCTINHERVWASFKFDK